MTDCAFRIAQERAVATAARKKQTKPRFIKTCVCGCGKAFGVIHNSQVVRNECRVAWDKKRNREQSQRKRDEIKNIGPPNFKRVPMPIHLQSIPAEKLEAAISAMIRDQS